MASSVLSGILKVDQETKKSFQSIDTTLQKLFKLEEDKNKREISERKADEQARKTKEKEGSVLDDILKELKSSKKSEDKKESLFDKLKAGLGFITKGLGSIFGKGGLIGKLLMGAIGGKFFEGILGPLFKGLFKVGGPIFGVVTSALIGWKIGEWLNKNVIETYVKPKAREVATAAGQAIDKNTGGGSYRGVTTYNIEVLARQKFERTQDNLLMGTKAATGAEREYIDKDLASLKALSPLIKERKKLNDELYNALQGNDKEKIEKLKRELANKETELNRLWETFSPGLVQELQTQKRQRGGPITVPGHGDGDKVPMMLPPGSFVMNRNAAAMFQSGGLVPTLLEPGEKVFGPGEVSPLHHMFNSMVPRFQEGGEVATKSKGDQYLYTLATTNKLVSAGQGMCTASVAQTLDANNIPNPTSNVDSNNPRGYAIGLVNKYGWKSVGGTPTQLSGGDGSATLGIMPQKDYLANVAANKIPSGALVFSTKHEDWFGNKGSSGYDTAIARNGGNNLYNGWPPGQTVGSSMYGAATKTAMVLVPKDSTLKGNFTSGSGDSSGGSSGDVASAPTNFMDKLLGSISGLGPVGEAIGKVFGGFKSAMGEHGDMLLNAMFGTTPGLAAGPSQPTTGTGSAGSGGTADTSLTPNRRAMLDTIAMAEGTEKYPDHGYKTMFTGKQFQAPPWKHPELIQGSGSLRSDAAGRYQFLSTTWNPLGLPDFSPKNQDKGAIKLLQGRNALGYVDAGKWDKAFTAAKQEWASFPGSTYGQPTKDMQTMVSFAESAAKKYSGGAATMQTGGIVNMSGTQSANTARFKQAQEEFAQMIADKSGSPIIVMGGGGSNGPTPVAAGSSQPAPPSLPTLPSSLAAAAYWNQLSMQDVC